MNRKSPRARSLLASVGVIAGLALSAAAYSQAGQDTDSAGRPKGFDEWNMSRDVYVRGDPLLLDTDNMDTGKYIAFVSCPYIRDSEPTPLWLSDYDGETYFLRAQQNTTASVRHPQLKHKILVEGIVSDEPRLAGGLVLNPLQISVLPEVDVTCNTMLPADGSKVDFAKRPPGPGSSGKGRVESAQRRTDLAERLWAKDYTPDAVDAVRKTEEFRFGFDDAVVTIPDYSRILGMVKYARDVNASRIEIHAQRGAVRLSDGTTIEEKPETAMRRAKAVEAIILDHPLDPDIVRTDSAERARPARGRSDFANRLVTVTVIPGTAR